MPARLVYSPQVYAYTKAQNGTTYNLSNYVVSGQVQRLINQVSSASLTLRNPQKLFTGGQGQPRAFHPMDPITIYLERMAGHPVRVFTGYLDQTPYFQLYPGTITLEASCTLKRLLYTYFDPSLPYVTGLFTQYGWVRYGNGSIISKDVYPSGAPATQADVNSGKKPFTDLNDGSLGKLLWATLYDIGQWEDSNIWIENLPSGGGGIAKRMATLMQSITAGETDANTLFSSYLEQVIGASSQGSGAGNGTVLSGTRCGNVTDTSKIVPTMVSIANQHGLPPQFVLCVWYCEGKQTGSDPPNSSNAVGYFQFINSTPYPGVTVNYPTDAQDLCFATGTFCNAAVAYAKNNKVNMNDQGGWQSWGEGVQQPGAGMYDNTWAAGMSQASQWISQYGKGSPAAGSSSPSAGPTTTQSGATAPASSTSGGGTSLLANIFPTGTKGTLERTDEGVDFSFPDGIKIGAIGAGTVSVTTTSGFDGQPLVMVTLDKPIGNYKAWYMSEGIKLTKTSGHVEAGEEIAVTESHGSGIETGWADPNTGWPAAQPHYQDGQMTAEGKDFANAIGVAAISDTQPITVTGTGAAGTSSGGTTTGPGTNNASAFVAELNFPSTTDMVTATALGAEHRGLMHDQSLLPFVQQLTQASLRSFQSLPNGDFYAFYPDYFGEMGNNTPYWLIDDIEILSGGIDLNDDALATHVFAVGDNTWPNNTELINDLYSTGAINIFNAFVGTGVIDKKSLTKNHKKDGLDPNIMDAKEAVEFIQRYGARPLVQQYPMVRNPIFEMLLAYQQFMFAWSNQFKTPYSFTFMPELYPGGKVGFPQHGIQMYINSVTHSFSYEEGGFTTSAELTAPSLLDGVSAASSPDLPPYMVQAMVEPLRLPGADITPHPGPPKTPAQQGAQSVISAVEQGVKSISSSLLSKPF